MLNKNSKLTNVCWTCNNPFMGTDGNEIDEKKSAVFELMVQRLLTNIARVSKKHIYTIVQAERGEEEGVLHLQGFSAFEGQISLGEKGKSGFLKAFEDGINHPHVERMKGTCKESIEYCEKEATRVAGPWEIGDRKKIIDKGGKGRPTGKTKDEMITELAAKIESGDFDMMKDFDALLRLYGGIHGDTLIREALERKRSTEIRNVRIACIVGGSGWGKSYTMNDLLREMGCAVMRRQICAGKNTVWFSNVDNECDVLYLDEFDAGQIDLPDLNQLLDDLPVLIPSKGKSGYATYTKVIICSNFAPEQWFQKEFTKLEYDDSGEKLVRKIDEKRNRDWQRRKDALLRRVGLLDMETTDAQKGRTWFLDDVPNIIKRKREKGELGPKEKLNMMPLRENLKQEVKEWLWPELMEEEEPEVKRVKVNGEDSDDDDEESENELEEPPKKRQEEEENTPIQEIMDDGSLRRMMMLSNLHKAFVINDPEDAIEDIEHVEYVPPKVNFGLSEDEIDDDEEEELYCVPEDDDGDDM